MKNDQFKKDIERVESVLFVVGGVVMTLCFSFLLNALFLK